MSIPATLRRTVWLLLDRSSSLELRLSAKSNRCVILRPKLMRFQRSPPMSPVTHWYHHLLGHNLFFGLFVTVIAFLLSSRKWITAVLTILSFHVHLAMDLAGSRGGDGFQWPIVYLWPFSDSW